MHPSARIPVLLLLMMGLAALMLVGGVQERVRGIVVERHPDESERALRTELELPHAASSRSEPASPRTEGEPEPQGLADRIEAAQETGSIEVTVQAAEPLSATGHLVLAFRPDRESALDGLRARRFFRASAPGTRRLEGLEPGRYEVLLEASSGPGTPARRHATVLPGHVAPVHFDGLGRFKVAGRVRLGDEPLQDASVGLASILGESGPSGATVRTGPDGGFALVLAEPGEFVVRVRCDRPALTWCAGTVVVDASGSPAWLELELPTTRVHGRVLDSDGRPLAGVRVGLAPDALTPPLVRTTRGVYDETDAQGRYSFVAVARCLQRLSLRVPDEAASYGQAAGVGLAQTVQVTGDSLERDLVLPRADTRLAIRLKGARAAGERVLVWIRPAGGEWTRRYGQLDEHGRLELGHLAPGEVEVQLFTLHGHTRNEGSDAARTVLQDHAVAEVEVALVPTADLHVSVRERGSPLPVPCALAVLDASGARLPMDAGNAWPRSEQAYGGLRVGDTYTILAVDGRGRRATAELEVATRGPIELELTFDG